MKKILSIVLALTMVLSLGLFVTGCGDNDNENKGSAPADNDETSSTVTTDELVTVTEGKLTMGTNAYFQPYEYYDGDKIIGIDAEIAEAIAKELGLELKIKDMNFDTIITAVNQGEVDFGLAGMTVTEDRLKDVDFSVSYATGVQVVIVKTGSAIKSVDDLSAEGATYKVGVQLGTTGDIYCTDDFGADRVTAFATGNEAIVALKSGDVDCVIIDNEPAKKFVENNAGLEILETSYADEDYAAAIKKGNTALLEAVNAAIVKLTANGTIDTIINKYIK